MDLMIFASGAESVVVPRALRRNLFERLIMPCCLPAWAAVLTLYGMPIGRKHRFRGVVYGRCGSKTRWFLPYCP